MPGAEPAVGVGASHELSLVTLNDKAPAPVFDIATDAGGGELPRALNKCMVVGVTVITAVWALLTVSVTAA